MSVWKRIQKFVELKNSELNLYIIELNYIASISFFTYCNYVCTHKSQVGC